MSYITRDFTSPTMEIVDRDSVKKVMALDAALVATNKAAFMKQNELSYYVLLNTWGLQVSDVTPEGWASIRLQLSRRGAIPVIKDCADTSDDIIHGNGYVDTAAHGYLIPLISACGDDFTTLLQLLRYPKRFSPASADKITAESLKKFKDFNAALKYSNRQEKSPYLVSRVREIIAEMISTYRADWTKGYFSSGVAADSRRPLADKLIVHARYAPCFDTPLYPLSDNAVSMRRSPFTGRCDAAVVAKAVPKNYKTARIIAEEPASNQYFLQAISKGLQDALRDSGYDALVDVNDQSENQLCAYEGSVTGKYATIDLSSASDSISESLARSLLPYTLLRDCDEYRCSRIKFEHSEPLMQMFATSGNAITFVVESIIFCAIAIAATLDFEMWSGDTLVAPHVFGDDICVDDRACTLTCEYLELLGFTVNHEKTFMGETMIGRYRESCGVEYLNGVDVATKYYPRKTVMLDAEGIQSLCALQHRLYPSWRLRMFLAEVITRIEPRMTSHREGEECSDMWDYLPICRRFSLGKIDEPYAERERYLTLKRTFPKGLVCDPITRTLTVSGKKACSQVEDKFRLLDIWYYRSYLLHGPLYASPLDELLRVSTARSNYAADMLDASSEWAFTTD